jgi:hypothetical protein
MYPISLKDDHEEREPHNYGIVVKMVGSKTRVIRYPSLQVDLLQVGFVACLTAHVQCTIS